MESLTNNEYTVHSPPLAARGMGHPAFTLIELMIVIAIIAVLITVILKVSQSVIENGRRRDTAAMLQQLQQAIDLFADAAPLKRNKYVTKRYGKYPPDELEAYTEEGVPCAEGPQERSLAPSEAANQAEVFPDPIVADSIANQDIKAMVLGIRLYSPEGTAILDSISTRFRRAPDLDGDGLPSEFLDAPEGANPPDGIYDDGEMTLDYFIDSWGTPIAYFAVRDKSTAPCADADTDNTQFVVAQGARRRTSVELIRVNDGRPVLVSYGPDGETQLSPDFAGADGHPFDLITDWNESEPPPRAIDHPFNADNVYVDEALAERLRPSGAS